MQTIQDIAIYSGVIVACCASILLAMLAVAFLMSFLWHFLRFATKNFRFILRARSHYMQYVKLFNDRTKRVFVSDNMSALAFQYCKKCDKVYACNFQCYANDDDSMVVDFVPCKCEVK